MTVVLVIGMLVGIALGVTYGFTQWKVRADHLSADLNEAEKHIRRLENTNEGLAYRDFWRTEAERLRSIHAGTPYAGPGVRDGMYSAAYLDDEEAA